ncbi:hypothetical protein HanIR_Chr03g0136541 [Helianthus annuus]|nr:hypothetical protein HanIR_Chr03g0136541 [Helianthus annuus]
MTIIGHASEGMARLGKVLCECILSLTQMGGCSRTSRLQNPSRLSMLHKGRFKGKTYLSCNTRLSRFYRGIFFGVFIDLHSCGGLLEI